MDYYVLLKLLFKNVCTKCVQFQLFVYGAQGLLVTSPYTNI